MQVTGEPLEIEPNPVRSRAFPHYHPLDRNFFLIFLLVCWLGVIMGFWPAVTKRFGGHADYAASWVLQVHAFAFTGWLLLLALQIALVRTSRRALHRKFGLTGAILIPVMAVSALISEIYSQRYYFDHPPNSQAFFIVPIVYAIAFTTLASTALFLRKRPSAHKRLILLATTVIVGAAYARWWGEGLTKAFGDGFWGMIINTYSGTNLLLAAAVGYDLFSRKKIHIVYTVGVPVLLIGELVVSWIYHSPDWLPIARTLIGR